MRQHSVIFCGTPAFAVPSLRTLADDPRFHVQLVITQPDRPVGRKAILTPPAVKEAALERGLPVFQPQDINKELLPYLKKNDIPAPDFLAVVAYGQILHDDILALPKIAPVNVHGSLLPRWRGASPIEHALLDGDTETGITIQKIVRTLDAGDILAQRSISIGPRETAPDLREKLSRLGAELLAATLGDDLHPTPQPKEGITLCRKLSREDGKVDPTTMTAEEIDRRVRALTPWPGVTMEIDSETLKILKTDLEASSLSAPLPCAQSTTLHLLEVQRPGGKPITGKEWQQGR